MKPEYFVVVILILFVAVCCVVTFAGYSNEKKNVKDHEQQMQDIVDLLASKKEASRYKYWRKHPYVVIEELPDAFTAENIDLIIDERMKTK